MARSALGSIEREIHCLDSTRIATKANSLLAAFHDRGVDLSAPCGSSANHSRCWITWQLPDLNKFLYAVSMEVVEHTPGAFTMGCVSNDDDYCDSFCLESAILAYWLLKYHPCIKRLDLAGTVIFLTNFPVLFCKALTFNKGLEEVRIDTTHMWDAWHGIHVYSALASTLANMSVRLSSLDIQKLAASDTAVEEFANTIRKGAVDRLVAWNGMSRRTTSKLLRAVGGSSFLNVLEMGGCMMSTSSAVILAAALKSNVTLRKLCVRYLGEDVVGIILTSLKHNNTLEELSLLYSHEISHSTLWNGFQALRTNTSLKRLELIQTILTSSGAIVIADVLRENSGLQELCLSDNPISNLGAHALAKALQVNSSLKHLDVSNCRLTEDVVLAFAECLAENCTVLCVRLGDIAVSEEWTPPFPLKAEVFTRLDMSWNTRGLEQWAACIPQGDESCSRLCIAWTEDANPTSVTNWCYSVHVSCSSLTELVVTCPDTLAPECAKAFVSLLEMTGSLKKFTLGRVDRGYNVVTDIICAIARNKTLREANFHHNLRSHQDVKALQILLRTNRSLNRLKFKAYHLSKKALHSLAQALEDNFVFLSLEFEYSPALKAYPLRCTLNRNQSLLNRAVDCVLNGCVDAHSMQAFHFLSTSDSLVSAVAAASGKTEDECKRMVQEVTCRLSSDI